MNRQLMKLPVLAGIVFLLYSCTGENEKNTHPDRSGVLNSRPFKGITDSINRWPDNVELVLRRAVMLSQNNLHQVATPDYEKAWKLTGDENIALEYASNLLLASQVTQAISLLQEGSERFPDNTEFSRRLGEIYMQNGDNRKALSEYNKIIARDSSNFEAWFDKGTLLAKMRDTGMAITALENSFAILPINYSGIALADIYTARRDPRALEICDILMSRDSGGVQTEPLYMKGIYYAEVKDFNNALQQFDECIKRDWKMTDAYIEKGIIHYERKQYEEALKIFNMAATVSNTDADAYYWMGRCFEATGKVAEAVTNYERAAALDHGLSEARDALRRLNS